MKTDIRTYQEIVSEIFCSVSQAIGVHVMLLVIERALWKTKFNHDEAGNIQFSEEGICLDGLANIAPEQATAIAHEFTMTMVATLGRLVGIQMAGQLTEQLKKNMGEELA